MTLHAVPALLLGLLGPQAPCGLANLPLPRATHAVQLSSHDPAGTNEDHGHCLEVRADGTRVLARCAGPGRITRIWSANPSGELVLELDGEQVWRGPFQGLFDGSMPPFVPPLAGPGGGGFTSHVPIPFCKSCVVTVRGDASLYHHIGIQLGAEAERFAMPPGPLLQRDMQALTAGATPRDVGTQITTPEVWLTHRASLAHIEASGEILELRLTPLHGALGRDAWLEVRADGEAEPCLAGPLGDTFGQSGDDAIETQPIGGLGRARVFRLPLPFHRSIDLDAVPLAPDAGLRFRFEVTWRRLPADHQRLYLHGAFFRAHSVRGRSFPLLEVAGRGHFVGSFVTMAGASGQGLSFLEGDETIEVDGAPVWLGTGTEDYFDGAWYFRTGTFGQLFAALCTLDAERGRVAAARFHVPDPIPFTSSLRFTLEHGGANDAPGADYAAMAFWYASDPRGREVDAQARRAWMAPQLAPGPVVRRAEDLWTLAPTAHESIELAQGTHPFAFDDYAPPLLVTALRAGHAAAQPQLVLLLEHGRVPFALPARTVLDALRIEPWLPSIRAWRIAGPFAAHDRKGIATVHAPELDAAPNAQYDVAGGGPRGWRELAPPGSANGYVDLAPWFVPKDSVVAYAATHVLSPVEQRATLIVGSDDSIAVFLNDARVHEHAMLRGAARDQDIVPIVLHAGDNLLLLEVENFAGGFGFFARIEDAQGLEFHAMPRAEQAR